MKALIVSRTRWDDNNSFGNSFTNILSDIEDIEIANIYLESGLPNNKIVSRSFQITLKSLIKNLLNKSNKTGKEIIDMSNSSLSDSDKKILSSAKKYRLTVFFWIREIIWKFGRWKSKELDEFIDDFKPDIMFQPIYYSRYLNRIALYCKKHSGIPMVGYISDDNYTLRQFSLSPLYWIDRLIIRQKVKQSIKQCDVLYVISDIQKQEYENLFGVECKVLTKSFYPVSEPICGDVCNKPLKMVYAGNIGTGRWKSLAMISKSIEKINCSSEQILLDIYTPTPLSEKMRAALCKKGTTLHEPLPYMDIIEIQREADILVHVESLDLKYRLQVHQSFSTKLVDFFQMAKCIFAIGTDDEASIKYLKDNDAAIVASTAEEAFEKLQAIVNDNRLIFRYGKRAYAIGKKNHNKNETNRMIESDLRRSINGKDTFRIKKCV